MLTATKDVLPEKERIAILKSCCGKSAAQLNAEVNTLLTKIIKDQATLEDRRRARVLATVILDRTGQERVRNES